MQHSTILSALAATFAVSLAVASSALAQGADNCIDSAALKGYGSFPFSTVGATTDGAADVLCNFFNNQNIYNDVWFRFTAPETTVIDVATCGGATWDTKIAIYGGADCSAPVIACSDDSCGTQTRVTVGVSAGQTYLFRVGAYAATGTGTGTLSVSPFAPLADITDPATGIRYVAINSTTWTAAESFAQLLGGHLVSINSQAEQDFVWSNFGSLGGVDRRVWIGFTDRDSEGAFAWSDGSPAKYTNWNPGEPNNSGGVEHYAELLGSSGRWNDLNDAGAGYTHIAVVELGSGGGGGGGGGGDPCPEDIDNDGFVDAADIAALLSGWGTPAGDVTGDGTTDAQDIAALLSAWGACVP
jgi:hypothetical protein